MDKEKNLQLKVAMDREITDMALKELDRLEEKIQILQKALKIAGRYVREYPPAEMPEDIDTIWCIADGASDPEGLRFIQSWISQAKELN